MDIEPQTNAMSEIALALSMAFFSIMVLTIVSMGPGSKELESLIKENSTQITESDDIRLNTNTAENSEHSKSKIAGRSSILIFHQGVFRDGDLKVTDPDRFIANAKGPVFLAVDPSLGLGEVIQIRQKFGGSEVTITALNDEWLRSIQISEK